jgi:hypothetical protein
MLRRISNEKISEMRRWNQVRRTKAVIPRQADSFEVHRFKGSCSIAKQTNDFGVPAGLDVAFLVSRNTMPS